MGLTETKSYIIDCDYCEGILEHNDYSIFPDDKTAMEAAMEEEWVQNQDGDYYCDKCASVDDDGLITLDESRKSLHAVILKEK